MKRYFAKRYRAKQHYRANFFRFFWRDNVASGVQLLEYHTIITVLRNAKTGPCLRHSNSLLFDSLSIL